jgi:hypothetical protein
VYSTLPRQLLNAWTNLSETWYVYHGIWAYFNGVLQKSIQSVCVCMFIPPTVARQQLSKHVPAATNIRNRGVVFYTVRVETEGRIWVCLYIPLSLIGKSSINTFQWQRRIVEGFVFCAVCAVSKGSGRSVLNWTSCLMTLSVSRL